MLGARKLRYLLPIPITTTTTTTTIPHPHPHPAPSLINRSFLGTLINKNQPVNHLFKPPVLEITPQTMRRRGHST